MEQSPEAVAAGRLIRRIAEGLARRADVAEVRTLLLQRATTDGLADRALFIEVLLSLDGNASARSERP